MNKSKNLDTFKINAKWESDSNKVQITLFTDFWGDHGIALFPNEVKALIKVLQKTIKDSEKKKRK